MQAGRESAGGRVGEYERVRYCKAARASMQRRAHGARRAREAGGPEKEDLDVANNGTNWTDLFAC